DNALAADKDPHPNATLPVNLVLRHAGSSALTQTTVNVRLHPPAGQGPMGVEEKIVFVSSPVWQAPFKGIQHTFDVTGSFIQGISQMITGAVKPQIAGLVGIVQIT